MLRTLVTLTLFSLSAFSGVIFQDNFDASLPATAGNANIPNWLEQNGTIDYLKSGAAGIPCRGGVGGCLDMDGSTGNAGDLRSIQTFNLRAGFTYEFIFWYSGSRRSGPDSMVVTFGGVDFDLVNIPANVDFTRAGIILTPLFDTSSDIVFSHAGGDNIGLILDDVTLTETSIIPEPSTFALMALALGGIAALRRR